MASTNSTLATGSGDAPFGLKARLATGATIVGCVAALALGGQRASEAAGVGPQATAQPQPVMLAVDAARCVYASVEGLPGEGCGPAQYTLIPVAAVPAAGLNCVYSSAEGLPGEGCGPVRPDDGRPQP